MRSAPVQTDQDLAQATTPGSRINGLHLHEPHAHEQLPLVGVRVRRGQGPDVHPTYRTDLSLGTRPRGIAFVGHIAQPVDHTIRRAVRNVSHAPGRVAWKNKKSGTRRHRSHRRSVPRTGCRSSPGHGSRRAKSWKPASVMAWLYAEIGR